MSPIAHSGMALLGWQLSARRKSVLTLAIFLAAANLPDIDFLARFVFGRTSIPLHQYYTHNLLFVVLSTGLVSLLLPAGRDRWGLLFVGLSHLVLDVIVIDLVKPVGIRALYPFSDALSNFGFFPYVQRGSLKAMATLRNLGVLALETAVFVLPVVLAFRKRLAREIGSRAFWSIGRTAP
jgi:membrane-bound metal-dependent hydrolase YbcI (DUF457 family)